MATALCAQATSPGSLNAISDELLASRVAAVLAAYASGTAADQDALPSLSKFTTLEHLCRVRNSVQDRINGGQCAMPLQIATALVLSHDRCVRPPADRSDRERCGNALLHDELKRRYLEPLRRIARSGSKSEAKAVKRAALATQLVEARFGCLEETPMLPEVENRTPGRAATPSELQAALVAEKAQRSVLAAEHRRLSSREESRQAVLQSAAMSAAEAVRQAKAEAKAKAAEVAKRERAEAEAAKTAHVAEREAAARKEAESSCNRHRGELERRGAAVVAAKKEAEAEHRKAEAAETKRQREAEKHEREIAQLEASIAEAEAKVQHLRDLKATMAKRARTAERKAATSQSRLERLNAAKENARDLAADLDEVHEELEEAQGSLEKQVDVCLEIVSENGRFGKYPWKLRLLIYGWLARRTPPSAIGPNLIDAARLLASGLKVREPSYDLLKLMRQVLTLLGEMLAAYQIASAKRLISFGFDETTKLGNGLASTNAQIETQDGEIIDVVMRGAFFIPGGTAEQVARSMETKLFSSSP